MTSPFAFFKKKSSLDKNANLPQDFETSRKLQDMSEQIDRLNAVIESMTEGVLVIDENQRVLLANTTFCKWMNKKTSDVLGHFSWELFRDESINRFLENSLKQQQNSCEQFTPLFSDNVYELRVSPVFHNNHFMGLVGVFHDMTKIQKLESMRRDFMANISHEFKTPLSSILGYAQTLSDELTAQSQLRKFADIICDNAERLTQMVDQAIHISRMESSQAPLESQPVSVHELLKDIVTAHQFLSAKFDVSLSLDLVSQDVILKADKQALRALFDNLISNAMKYNHAGGWVRIRTQITAEEVVIEVEDNGIGIAKQHQDRVFERFYRADKSRTRSSGGSGLGLSIAKHAAEVHKGRIELESEEGRGTLFRVFLPIKAVNT